MIISHLPDGPTVHFKLSSVKLGKDIKVTWCLVIIHHHVLCSHWLHVSIISHPTHACRVIFNDLMPDTSIRAVNWAIMVDITFCTFEYKLFEFFWEELDNENAYSTVQKRKCARLNFSELFFLNLSKYRGRQYLLWKWMNFRKGYCFN